MQIMKKSNKSVTNSRTDTQKLVRLEADKQKLHALLKITKNLTDELELDKLLFKVAEHVKNSLSADL